MHDADGGYWFRPTKWIPWCPPCQTVEMPCRWTEMERRNSLTRRATGQPDTGREEDVVDGGSEVKPHASMTVVAEEGQAFARPTPRRGECQRRWMRWIGSVMKNVAKFFVWAIQERHAGGGWERSSIGKEMETLFLASQNVAAPVSQRRVNFEIICTGRVGLSLIRASIQCDEQVVVGRKDAEGIIWNDEQGIEIRASGRVVSGTFASVRCVSRTRSPEEKEENKGIH